MKRKGRVVLLAVAAVGALAAGLLLRSQDRSATFEGRQLEVPKGWEFHSELTGPETLSLMKPTGSNDTPPATLDLIDKRDHPENPSTFLEGWKAAVGTKYFNPLSVEAYRDAAVDGSHLRCVAIRWKEAIPLNVYCVTQDGLWRIVLLGNDSDIGGLDELAQQMATFEGK